MPQKVLKFTSINRKVNEYQNSGACEELINLRPDIGGGHHVVNNKTVVESDVTYDAVFVHSFGNINNRIVVDNGVVKYLNEFGDYTVITDKFIGYKNISLSFAANVLVIYCEDTQEQEVYRYKNDAYKSYNVHMRQIVDAEIAYKAGAVEYSATSDSADINAINDTLQKAASAFTNTHVNGLCGAAVVACAYELDDGTEVWSTAYIVADASMSRSVIAPAVRDGLQVRVFGTRKVYLCLTFDDSKSIGVNKINIYSSRQIYPYEAYVDEDGYKLTRRINCGDLWLGGQVMYYQGSVKPDENTAKILLKFGTGLASEQIMDVNTGCTERIGNSVSYNNRFHYYNSKIRHTIQLPTVARDSKLFYDIQSGDYFYDNDDAEADEYAGSNFETSYWICYVRLNNEWKLIDKIYKFLVNYENFVFNNHFMYPMAGVERLAFVKAHAAGTDNFTVPYDEMFFVDMKDSQSYNYSYAFDVKPTLLNATSSFMVVHDFFNEVLSTGQIWGNEVTRAVTYKEEYNTINVSAPYNPFVFPVEYSYSFGGEIIDIETSYLPISSTQAGQYPITVFTSNGIYALEQGDGNVLYSNVVPLQPQVAEGRVKSTPYGTFFVSSNNLYVLSGRETANVSSLLNGSRELKIRDTKAYKLLCCTENGALYNFTKYLSGENFEDFIDDVVFTYDQLNNELYISSGNPDVVYSYVFNLDTKAYHKISKRYLESYNGARYVIEVNGDTRSVVDLHKEVDIDTQHILLQSRPFGLDVLYTHIKRLQMFADAKLEGKNQNLCLSVFGSDNLYDWKCIVSAQKHDTVLRQITTNRAAKSYKDYVILINGTVGTDTDLSEIIADYTIVSRRIG